MRVYLVDDQAIVRASLRSFLSLRQDIELVGDSGDARAALAAIEATRPDVVVLDIAMPGFSGLDLLPLLRKKLPRTRFVMLTHHEGDPSVERALKNGAEGYLSKDSDPAELALAVLAVQRGDPYVSPRVATGPVRRPRGGDGAPPGGITRLDALTQRERAVFRMLTRGKSNEEVGAALDISPGTARRHRENLQKKLGCRTAAELARLAIREGLPGP